MLAGAVLRTSWFIGRMMVVWCPRWDLQVAEKDILMIRADLSGPIFALTVSDFLERIAGGAESEWEEE